MLHFNSQVGETGLHCRFFHLSKTLEFQEGERRGDGGPVKRPEKGDYFFGFPVICPHVAKDGAAL